MYLNWDVCHWCLHTGNVLKFSLCSFIYLHPSFFMYINISITGNLLIMFVNMLTPTIFFMYINKSIVVIYPIKPQSRIQRSLKGVANWLFKYSFFSNLNMMKTGMLKTHLLLIMYSPINKDVQTFLIKG